MSRKSKLSSQVERRASRNNRDEIEETEEEEAGFFGRLFSPGTVDTSVSEESRGEYDTEIDGESVESGTFCTDVTGSHYDEDSDASSGISTTGSSLVSFDKELKAKHRAACKSMTIGKYPRAIKIFESILSALLNRFGEEHHRVGSALHNVAVANLRSGLLDDARDAIEEAVRIRKLTLGDDEPKVADSLVEYGIILLSMKKYKKSVKVFNDALELREIEFCEAEDSASKREAKLKKAKIQHNIGCVNFEIQNYDEARKNYLQAIKEQKEIFGPTWISFGLLTNSSKPGHLTLASTMCNKGYIDLEQEKYKDAIDSFKESLKIQKVLLEADNKLILSTMTNIAYSHFKLDELGKARDVYKQLVKLQSESYTAQSQKGWSQSLKKLIYCQVVLFEFEDAFENLRLLEEYFTAKPQRMKVKNVASELRKTHQLMGEVNYQIFKFPTLSDYTSRLSCTNGCGCSDDRKNVDVKNWIPKKPVNGSKMSGHRMTYA